MKKDLLEQVTNVIKKELFYTSAEEVAKKIICIVSEDVIDTFESVFGDDDEPCEVSCEVEKLNETVGEISAKLNALDYFVKKNLVPLINKLSENNKMVAQHLFSSGKKL